MVNYYLLNHGKQFWVYYVCIGCGRDVELSRNDVLVRGFDLGSENRVCDVCLMLDGYLEGRWENDAGWEERAEAESGWRGVRRAFKFKERELELFS